MAVLTELRLNHAKRLLRETSLPIAEVAAASGYSEVSYFGRRFRIEVGCTPSEYRRTDRA
jgi:AraC-like DNA-binding protein